MQAPARVYAGAQVALLARHGKQRVTAPALEAELGCRVRHVDGYDTDLLGTSMRDVPRFGTQLEAARKKARMTNIGLAAANLAARLASLCADCGAPTRETRAEDCGCLKCAHRETRAVNSPLMPTPGAAMSAPVTRRARCARVQWIILVTRCRTP